MSLSGPPGPNARASSDPPPDGKCPSCGSAAGHYNQAGEVVTCRGCQTPWPSDYWREQVDRGE